MKTPQFDWIWKPMSGHRGFYQVCYANGEFIAGHLDESEARLIAQAPAMYDTIQELIAMVDELLAKLPQGTGCGWGTIATDNAKALLHTINGKE